MHAIDRLGAFSGAIYILFINLASAVSAPSGAQRELDWLRSGTPLVRIALALVLLGFAALAMFVGYLYSRTREAGWPAVTAAIAGTVTVALSLAAAGVTLSVIALQDVVSAPMVRVLDALEGGLFVVEAFSSGIFVFAVAWAALANKVFGRTLSYAGMAIGVITVLDIALTSSDLRGDLFAWPFLLVMLWVAVISLRLGFARTRAPAVKVGAAAAV